MAAPKLNLSAGDGPFGVATSGGPDSLALLLACGDAGAPVRAATVDHGIRAEAADEARWVGAFCAERGIAHDTITLSVPDGPGLQHRARQARYKALAAWSTRQRLGTVLLGHTADDVAESFAMRLSRGAGLDGLAAMDVRVRRGGAWFARPLLDLYRTDVEAILAAHGVTALQDPSNRQTRFERVRIRNALQSLGIPKDQIVASARALTLSKRSLQRAARAAYATLAREDRGDVVVDRAAWDALHRDDPDQARRVLLMALRAINRRVYPPRRAEQVELLRRVAEGGGTALGGCLVTTTAATIRLAREPAAAQRAAIVDPGAIWDNRWIVTGPTTPGVPLRIGPLGQGISQTPWREVGLPRRSLMASPAVWSGDTLVAAPVAGLGHGWQARLAPDDP